MRAFRDWAARLDPLAHRDAVTHFLGGEAAVVKDVEVRSPQELLGRQKLHLLSEGIPFAVTSSLHHPEAVLEHQRRFLLHTDLRAIQSVNLRGQTVAFHTISR